MAPLTLEAFTPSGWREIGKVNPTDRPGSLSNIREDGKRDVYVFECARDNSKSVIYRSRAGIDTANRDMRKVVAIGYEIIAELNANSEPYQIEIKSDRSKETRIVRFTHR